MANPQIQHLFVDEAGDLSLFNKRGASIVGREGSSKYFLLGVVVLPNPAEAARVLSDLRTSLLADPYFAGVPSMSADQRKTALCFHAKDDVAEVRREMFKVLPSLNPLVQVVIRDKAELIVEARALFRRSLKLRPNDVYDEMVRRLFQNLTQEGDADAILFARRGKSHRLQALTWALRDMRISENIYGSDVVFDGSSSKGIDEVMQQMAVERIAREPQQNQQEGDDNIRTRHRIISSAYPNQSAGLQIIDYYLWALQRLFERREDRFFNLLAANYRLIIDLDDKRSSPAGAWYSPSNALTLEKIKPDAS
jgi:hypothetical protein